jgi:hypothetical protein
MRELIKKQIEENYEKRMAYNLQANSFRIKKDLRIGDRSIESLKDFFFKNILPEYKNNNPRKIDSKLQNFSCLIANLYYSKNSHPLAVPLSRNAYKADSNPSVFIVDLVKILYEKQYIEIKKGFNCKNKNDSRVTRIWKTDKLKNELFFSKNSNVEHYHIVDDHELIILRDDSKKKQSVKFRNSKYTNQLRKDIAFINVVNRRFEVVCHSEKQPISLTTDLHAVFNNRSFEDGGRLYTGKRGYQGLYREDRSLITINGNETVELDYSGLHPHILYANVGIQAEGDQYKMVNPDEKLRPVLKNALLTLLNADSEKDMVRAGTYFLNKNYELKNVMRERNLTIYDLLKWFKTAHQKISHFFCTGQGVKLMNIDSDIAKGVLLHFANENEACLCIHDSFIVESKNENYLKNIMIEYYEKIISLKFNTGIKFTCKVEKK